MDTRDQRHSPAHYETTTGIVLAGGRSQRMGAEKAALMIGGEPLLRRVVRRLRAALPDVLVVGPESLQSLVPDARVVPDADPGRGPLGGIVTAFDVLAGPRVFAVACDMPFVEPALVRELLRIADESPEADVVALRTARGVEPLHAVYRSSCLPPMRAQLAAGEGALHLLLRQLRVREVPRESVARFDYAGLSSFNANTPEEWNHAQDLAAGEMRHAGQ